ncbi:MAG: hypothetical protein Q7K44_00240, partial [Candidatus Liptonbacteria bacterium]|nr:hypothetical protein [Candidatus Liptonbacteria bacterium]
MKLNFEMPQQKEPSFVNQETLDTAYAKAIKTLSEPIDPSDIGDNYRDVEKDLAYVEKLEKQFTAEAGSESIESQNR